MMKRAGLRSLAFTAGRMASGNVGSHLERLFGAEAGRPVEIVFKDWASDPLTATPADSPGPREHPPYGEPALSQTWLEGRLAFAGAEASQGQGGLIEGALEAADAAMERLFPASA